MPVVLTGDVHQAIGTEEQAFVNCSEAALAVKYAQIAASYDLKVTFFFTGRAIIENGDDARALLAMDNVEIGGHGWDALRPRWRHLILLSLTGSPHGLDWMQRRMIRRTCATIERYAGEPVRSWRNHAYRHNRQTPYLLQKAGIVVWSDRIDLNSLHPVSHPSGLFDLPINTTPDHENIYHAERTPSRAAAAGDERSYVSPALWLERVCEQVQHIIEAEGTATVLAHPICMKAVEDFAVFEQLCSFLSRYPALFARQIADPPADLRPMQSKSLVTRDTEELV